MRDVRRNTLISLANFSLSISSSFALNRKRKTPLDVAAARGQANLKE
jgi:hypothetical protein